MIYTNIFTLTISFVLMIMYLKIAAKLNIIDKPNQRSSHVEPTIRGGGLIYILIMWYYFITTSSDFYLILGSSLAAITAFIDDIKTLHQLPRLFAHFVGLGIVFYGVGFGQVPYIYWVFIFISFTGWVNAYNFMDGINGISFIYALVTLLSLFQYNILDSYQSLMLVMIFATIVFGFFNFRKKARVFLGDVGSVFLAFILGYLLFQLIFITENFGFILLFSVYGIDAVITILYRISKGENIFNPHRTHLYQYLANELKYSHVSVSVLYGLSQLIINFLVYYLYKSDMLNSWSTGFFLIVLSFIYFKIRVSTINKISN